MLRLPELARDAADVFGAIPSQEVVELIGIGAVTAETAIGLRSSIPDAGMDWPSGDGPDTPTVGIPVES